MSVEARNRSLTDWFSRIRTGQVKLPRFQRHEAWGHNEVASLLEAVLRGLPAGAALVLEVGGAEQFQSRFLKTAPQGQDRVTEQLLDGQQRLTALWRSLHDNYGSRSYFVGMDTDSEEETVTVLSQARWERGEQRYPLWCDSASQCWSRGWVPASLLHPDHGSQLREWADDAAGGDLVLSRDIETRVSGWRLAVTTYNLPYLSLPASTPKDVALEVFLKMNTSSVRLSAFDIVVAQLEEATGQSMHELVDDLKAAVPAAERYRDLGNLVLDVASLRGDRTPTQASYQRLDLTTVATEWTEIIEGIAWAVRLLEDEHVFDADRLPTVAVLPVLAALHRYVPDRLDAAGNARQLAKAYLWRAFLTPRYEQSAATRSLQDLRGLRDALATPNPLGTVLAPIFDEEQTPLPDQRAVLAAGWPKSREILARGILAASLRTGGLDLADGQTVRADNVTKREYHHLFPDSLLSKVAGLTSSERFTALNCALVTWTTNRNISNKSPLTYMQERVSRAQLGTPQVESRLASHLVPYAELASAGPYERGEADADQLRQDYLAFLEARARLVMPVLERLCRGLDPSS